MPKLGFEKYKEFVEIYTLPEEEKEKRGLDKSHAICRYFNISRTTYNKMARRIDREQKENNRDEFGEFIKYMKDEAFKKEAKSKDKELYARLKGWLIDKREDTVKFELTANEYNRIAIETIARIREEYKRSGGICPVCSRPQILHDQVCLDSKQEHSEGSEVATLSLPA